MRDAALALARLDDPGLEVVDVGAGTGFATEAIVRTRRARARDDARPEPAPARPRAAQARADRGGEGHRRRRGAPLRDRFVRPLRLDGQHRVLARSPARHRRGLPRPAAWRHRPARGPAAAHAPAGARALGRLDALPRRGRVRRVVRAGRLRVDRARARRPRLVGPELGPLRRGDRGRQAAAGEPPALPRARRAAEEPAPRSRCALRASRPARSPARLHPVALWFTLVRKLRRSG